MAKAQLEAINCKFVVDGFHIRAGFKKETGRWPNMEDISQALDNIISDVSQQIHEWTGVEFILSDWVYCDALLSITDENKIRNFVNRQASLSKTEDRLQLEFDLDRLVDARAIFSDSTNSAFNQNTIIADLEVKAGNWIRFPPRQTGVDTMIATELVVASRENGVIIVVSSDGGFAYTVKRLREAGFSLAIANVNYRPSGTGEKLKDCCSAYFLVDLNGKVEHAYCKPETKFGTGYVILSNQQQSDG